MLDQSYSSDIKSDYKSVKITNCGRNSFFRKENGRKGLWLTFNKSITLDSLINAFKNLIQSICLHFVIFIITL